MTAKHIIFLTGFAVRPRFIFIKFGRVGLAGRVLWLPCSN